MRSVDAIVKNQVISYNSFACLRCMRAQSERGLKSRLSSVLQNSGHEDVMTKKHTQILVSSYSGQEQIQDPTHDFTED